MISIIYSGIETNQILKQITRAIKPDKLAIIVDSVLDYSNADGFKVYSNLLSVLKSLSDIEAPKEEGYITKILEKINYVNFEFGEVDSILSLILSIIASKKNSMKEIIDEIRRKFNIQIPIVPITDLELKVEVTLDLGEETQILTPLEFYKKNINGEIKDVFFENIDETKISDDAKKMILKSSGIIICQPDPLSIFTILNVPGIKEVLRDFPGKILAISHRKISEKQAKVMKALGQSPTIFGLINLYLNYVDALILDEGDTELVVKARAQDLGMEIIPINLDTTEEENSKNIIKKIVKVMEIEDTDLSEEYTERKTIKGPLKTFLSKE